MADDLRQRYAEATRELVSDYVVNRLGIRSADAVDWLHGRLMDVRDDELASARHEISYVTETGEKWRRLWEAVDRERSAALVRAEEAEPALARMDARHRPKQTGHWVSCSTHPFLRRDPDCPRCAGKPIWTCIQPGCKGWPCAEHLALQDEAEETCKHLPALDQPADGEQPPTPATEETDHG